MQQVINSDEPIKLDTIVAYKLVSMGLITLDGFFATTSCQLYRLYFCEVLSKTMIFYHSTQSNGQSEDLVFQLHKRSQENAPISFDNNDTSWYNLNFNMIELQRALKNVKSKSAGKDTISFTFYKNFSEAQQESLLSFYNYVFQNGFPNQWREAIIVPILKPGKNSSSTTSYRPIALTNCLCKIMEKMINWRLQAFLEEISFLDKSQSGFRSGRCTTDSLVKLETQIKDSLIDKEYCVAVFLDISKAFDTVWHHGLLAKLAATGIKGRLASFLQQFLSQRKIQVKIGQSISNSFPMAAGVPQGSVISPTLFNAISNTKKMIFKFMLNQ